jgi:branched-chain amino acid transport system ATP-binding protein
MLEVKKLSIAYGQHRALAGVSLNIEKGEIVVILGANGAGKSTLLRAIGGLCEGSRTGEVTMAGEAISGLPSHEIVERGIALVPEGRGVFAELTVRENLLLGAYVARARAEQATNMDRVLRLFPKLAERQTQIVAAMSGGEQQMVAIGRAIMSSPTILMLDEPSLGLSPILCRELFQSLAEVRELGLGIFLVEQNAKLSLAIADRGYLLENSQIVGADSALRLANDPAVRKAYLGGAMPADREA